MLILWLIFLYEMSLSKEGDSFCLEGNRLCCEQCHWKFMEFFANKVCSPPFSGILGGEVKIGQCHPLRRE